MGGDPAADSPPEPEDRRRRELLERILRGLLTDTPPLSADALGPLVEHQVQADLPVRDGSMHWHVLRMLEAFASQGRLSPPLFERAERFVAMIRRLKDKALLLMEPDDQYLCIVPKPLAAGGRRHRQDLPAVSRGITGCGSS